ncbi:MAG TPA: glucosamine-6-phosphate deaminase, partial [Acidimicrobiia bacterium]
MSAARAFTVDALTVRVHDSIDDLAADAAREVEAALTGAIAARGAANVMLATGNSQLAFLDRLVDSDAIDWSKVTAFHMDEYVGISRDHPASFQRYMRERVAAKVPIGVFHYLNGDAADADAEAARYATLLVAHPLDVCCLGIGENGHLAFNDPPVADFHDRQLVKIVTLDDACRRQQVGEGHFATVADVPPQAITITIPELLSAGRVVAVVPELRKADAVHAALTGPIAEACPGSALRTC